MADEEFIQRAEAVIKELEKTKNWYKASSFTFFIATIALIGSIYLNNYRINNLEEHMSQAASKRGVGLLTDIHNAEVKALSGLIDNLDKKEILREVHDVCNKTQENIIFYSLGVTRSGKKQ